MNSDPINHTDTTETLELPEVTDEWVAENFGEFDSVRAWRASLAEKLSTGKLNQARNVFIDRTTSALADLVDAPAPDSMVSGDLQSRMLKTVEEQALYILQLEERMKAMEQRLKVLETSK